MYSPRSPRIVLVTRLVLAVMLLAVAALNSWSVAAQTPTRQATRPASISGTPPPLPPIGYPDRASNLAPAVNQAASDAMGFGTKTLPDIFGGVWVERGGTKVHVLLKDTSPTITSRFSQNVRNSQLVVYDAVQFSQRELRDLQRRIVADRGVLGMRGVTFAGVGEKTSQNKLIVDVVSTTAAATATAVAVLAQLYGTDAVDAQAVAAPPRPTNRSGGYPYHDGYRLAPQGGIDTCTLGFIGYTASSWQIVTGGHCFTIGTTVTTPGIGTIGNVTSNDYRNNSRVDAAGISFSGYDIGSQHNLIRNDPNVAAVVEVELYQYENKRVCKSGMITEETCFYVNRAHISYPLGGVLMEDQLEAVGAPGSIAQGDSGGPVYMPFNPTQVSAEGITSGKNGDGSMIYYSFVATLAPDMGIYIWRG